MDLNKLFSLLCDKKLGYIDCAHHTPTYMKIFASTGFNGRGAGIELRIDHGKITLTTFDRKSQPIDYIGISEDEALKIIEEFKTNGKL